MAVAGTKAMPKSCARDALLVPVWAASLGYQMLSRRTYRSQVSRPPSLYYCAAGEETAWHFISFKINKFYLFSGEKESRICRSVAQIADAARAGKPIPATCTITNKNPPRRLMCCRPLPTKDPIDVRTNLLISPRNMVFIIESNPSAKHASKNTRNRDTCTCVIWNVCETDSQPQMNWIHKQNNPQ